MGQLADARLTHWLTLTGYYQIQTIRTKGYCSLIRRVRGQAIILAGILFPFLCVFCISSYGRGDVATFRAWSECLLVAGTDVYLKCKPDGMFAPNYPAVGLLLSAGVYGLIEGIGSFSTATADQVFRFYLCLYEVLNFVLFSLLAKRLGIPWPWLLGLAISMTPSTWTSTAVWGQIDGAMLSLCLIGLLGLSSPLFVSATTGEAGYSLRRVRLDVGLAAGGAAFGAYMLTKQLAVLSLPGFCLLLGAFTLYLLPRHGCVAACRSLVIAMLGAVSLFVLVDQAFAVPHGVAGSSLWHVWHSGSGHGEKISGNGFNVWVLLGRDGWSSSLVPFATIDLGWRELPLRPYRLGRLMFLGVVAVMGLVALKGVFGTLRLATMADRSSGSRLMGLLVVFLGLTHLAFNVFVAGTHERYLHGGYPFLLLGTVWLYCVQRSSRRRALLIATWCSAVVFGLYVLAVLWLPAEQRTTAGIPWDMVLACWHAGLFVWLACVWISETFRETRFLSSSEVVPPERNEKVATS